MNAWVVKLVDTRDLKSRDLNGRAGSIPAPGTIYIKASALNGAGAFLLEKPLGQCRVNVQGIISAHPEQYLSLKSLGTLDEL